MCDKYIQKRLRLFRQFPAAARDALGKLQSGAQVFDLFLCLAQRVFGFDQFFVTMQRFGKCLRIAFTPPVFAPKYAGPHPFEQAANDDYNQSGYNRMCLQQCNNIAKRHRQIPLFNSHRLDRKKIGDKFKVIFIPNRYDQNLSIGLAL